MFYWWRCHLWLRLLCRLGKILFVPAKSIQKPREQKNSSGDRIFDLAFEVSVFHVYDFLPLLRRVIRKSCFRALEQFLLTFRWNANTISWVHLQLYALDRCNETPAASVFYFALYRIWWSRTVIFANIPLNYKVLWISVIRGIRVIRVILPTAVSHDSDSFFCQNQDFQDFRIYGIIVQDLHAAISCSPRFQPWVTRSHSPLTVLTVYVAGF